MEDRTRAYLRGRFGDYYRRAGVPRPPDANAREWGYVPWTAGPGETMVRHRSLLDLGDLNDFLERERPKHVYFSAGRYEEPGASTMAGKTWLSSDLIFDLDADHLPGVTPGEDTYSEMLAACKEALLKLLSFLEEDFGFDDLTIVFSGARGYHVHVRDEAVQRLESDARREIVDYVRGIGLEPDALVDEEPVAGIAGRQSPARKRTLSTAGGWSARVHRRLLDLLSEVRELEEEAAVDRLRTYDGIGEGNATAVLRAARENMSEIRRGNVDVHPAVYRLTTKLIQETVATENAPIDEPVTTDINRLIRLPGSLHGGSGLAVRPIDRHAIDDFDPLVDAVPETFRGHEISIEVTDGGRVELGGDTFTLEPGDRTVPEFLGVFLMARGRAEKGRE
ncbi:MAG: DNA primase small subunit PriS [Salinirussus sp.]